MKARLFSSLTAMLIAVGPLASAVPALAAPNPPGPEPISISDEVRDWEANAAHLDLSAEALDEVSSEPTTASTPVSECTLDSKIFLILNDFLGAYQLTFFNLVAESDQTQIWVQANLAWPAGDPRPTPEIFCEQAEYMMGEFDNNMYPTEVDFFGPPDAHDGSGALLPGLVPSLGLPPDYYADPAGRQIVLVSNVRDENYYDSTFPLYIAGFYSSTLELYFDRNVMTIDAFDWADRTGPDGSRPFLYEGVFAHEYQHLLHDDYDSGEETFVNEGLSDFAEFLTGYHVALAGHIGPAATHPENSLVVWEDQGGLEILTDYGQAYLFQLYLYEQFGQEMTQALFHNPGHGISGIEAALDEVGATRSFADVFHHWSVALLIDSTKPQAGRYAFVNEDFHIDMGTPESPNPEAFDTPGAPPWGTDYIWIEDPGSIATFTFNGVDFSMFPSAWTSDGDVLWSGAGDLIDNWAIFETEGGGVLTFDTTYALEELWDFGFVQVSTDDGQSWTSLPGALTSDPTVTQTTDEHDPGAHPKVVENVPGLTGSSDWVNLSYDLGAYAGEDILVAFRCVTDWAFFEDGWFVDNVMVDETLISDGSDASVFQDITGILPIDNDFTVTFVGYKGHGSGNQYKIASMKIDRFSESFMVQLQRLFAWSDQVAMLVTFDAPEGFTGYAEYTYGFESMGAAAAREAGADK
jgi:hypothetical protein